MELVKWLGLAWVLLLAPMILVHELGHFLVARLAGVRVPEFGLGFPPRLFTIARERGRLAVDGVEMVLPGRVRLLSNLQPGQSVAVLVGPDRSGARRVRRVERIENRSGQEGPCDGRWLCGTLTALEPGTAYTLNLIPAGAFVRLLGEEDPSHPRSLAAQPKRWRLATLLSGPLMNLLAAFLILTAAYVSGVPTHQLVQIEEVVPDTPADDAGLQPGDILASVNGERLQDGPTQLREHIVSSAGQPIVLGVLREGQELTVTAIPRLQEGHGFLGISMQPWPDPAFLVRYSLPGAGSAAAQDLVGVVMTIFRLPRLVAEGQVEPGEALRPTGVPGILQLLALYLRQSLEWRIAFPALQVTALIALALGLTNLLPLPALDGGRVLFVLIEAVRGRRVSPATEAVVHGVGMVILLTLSVVIVVQDIVNPLFPWSLLGR